MRDSDPEEPDPMRPRGRISTVLAEARASLKNPSRPFTPAEKARPLFSGSDYRPTSRPTSAFMISNIELVDIPSAQEKLSSPSIRGIPRKLTGQVRHPEPLNQGRRGSRGDGKEEHVHKPDRGKESDEEQSADQQQDEEEEDAPQAAIDALQLASLLERTNPENLDNVEFTKGVWSITDHLANVHEISNNDHLEMARHRLLQQFYRVISTRDAGPGLLLPYIRPALRLLLCSSILRSNEEVSRSVDAGILALVKILFKLSQNPSNDDIFISHKVDQLVTRIVTPQGPEIEGNGERDKSECSWEAATPRAGVCTGRFNYGADLLIYASGILKNLSNSSKENQNALVDNGCIDCLAAVLQCQDVLTESSSSLSRKQLAQILVQVTSALRNFSANSKFHRLLWLRGVAEATCNLVDPYNEHAELMLNVARILSKLSVPEEGSRRLARSARYLRSLIRLLGQDNPSATMSLSPSSLSLLVRVTFTLGNITALCDDARVILATELKAVPQLIQVFSFYAKKFLGSSENKDEREGKGREVADLLVKTVRLLANLAINSTVGESLSRQGELLLLPQLLKVVTKDSVFEELMLNIVSCITNLSFYCSEEEVDIPSSASSPLWGERMEVTRALLPVLLHENEEAVVEGLRAYGNFSRSEEVRASMSASRVLELLVVLLDHGNRDILFNVCGVLVNVAGDDRHREILLSEEYGTCVKLLSVLESSASAKDFEVAILACRVVSNLIMGDSKDRALLPEQTRCELMDGISTIRERVQEDEEGLKDEVTNELEKEERKRVKETLDDLLYSLHQKLRGLEYCELGGDEA